jgi:plastocyanin
MLRPQPLLAAALASFALLLSGCEDAGRPLAPVLSTQSAAATEERLVTMMDACAPETFNAAKVSCVRSGGVTFQDFLELVGKHHTIGSWHFAPGTINARVGQTLLAVNQGGEVHSFTEVEKFGGGANDFLNGLSGNPVPAPECQNLPAGKFIAQGAADTDELEEPGIEHYQCCIHPWMRLDVHVRP